MEGYDARTVEQPGESTGVPRERSRRWRLVPPAITPLELADLGAGSVGQLRGGGRDRFRRDIEAFLDAESSSTYTSFRRALAGCFHEIAAVADDDTREVLIPAFCSSDFLEAIEGVGLEAVRYDIDPETLAFDATSLEERLCGDTCAVVAINVLGYGSPMTELADRCAVRDVCLVEALGYALGTEYDGQPLGTFGDCAVLNFQQGKPIPVGGGMVVGQGSTLGFTDEGRPSIGANVGALTGYAALSRPRSYYAYSKLKSLLDVVGSLDVRATTHPESKFDVEYAPPFATISDFQGAIAHRVFEKLDEHRRQRTATAEFYTEELSACPRVEHLTPIPGLSKLQHIRFPLVAETEQLRDRIKDAIVDAGVQATTLYDWPVIDPDTFRGAGYLQRRILTLPTHPYVDSRDRRLIVDTVRDTVVTT